MSNNEPGNIVEIVKEFRFEAAHKLTNVPEGHKCGRVHGHSFRMEVRLQGEIDPENNWLIDFGDISSIVKPMVDGELDHNYLNDLPGIGNPTSEALLVWIWKRLKPQLPQLVELVLHETNSARCIYRG